MAETDLGVKQIARALACSEKTVYRKYEAKALPGAYQTGGKGSAIKMPASALKKIKGEE